MNERVLLRVICDKPRPHTIGELRAGGDAGYRVRLRLAVFDPSGTSSHWEEWDASDTTQLHLYCEPCRSHFTLPGAAELVSTWRQDGVEMVVVDGIYYRPEDAPAGTELPATPKRPAVLRLQPDPPADSEEMRAFLAHRDAVE